MSETVIKNAAVLKFLAQAKPRHRKVILKTADKDLILCLCECVYNTIKGKVPLSTSQKQKLKSYKNILRKIAKKGEPIQKKKKFLIQKGGALLPLILAPLISGVLSSLFN